MMISPSDTPFWVDSWSSDSFALGGSSECLFLCCLI
ncbi:unnamed protein product [Amoebophrya sp. A25]|nr:unnamed protein product [Amoebophrya sp. A25]|eukprot:GSA25T00016773001.1